MAIRLETLPVSALAGNLVKYFGAADVSIRVDSECRKGTTTGIEEIGFTMLRDFASKDGKDSSLEWRCAVSTVHGGQLVVVNDGKSSKPVRIASCSDNVGGDFFGITEVRIPASGDVVGDRAVRIVGALEIAAARDRIKIFTRRIHTHEKRRFELQFRTFSGGVSDGYISLEDIGGIVHAVGIGRGESRTAFEIASNAVDSGMAADLMAVAREVDGTAAGAAQGLLFGPLRG